MPSFKQYLTAFIIGSSLIATFITFSYTGNAFHRSGHGCMEDKTVNLHYEYMPFIVLGVLGLGNVADLWARNTFRSKLAPFIVTSIVGALTGLSLSFVGRFGNDLPVKIFGFTREDERNVHLYAMGLYALIFSFLIQPINNYII